MKFSTGVANIAILSEIIGDSAIAHVETIVEGWYNARSKYQFPGGNESFDACNKSKTISEFSSFTQVRFWSTKVFHQTKTFA